MTRLHAAGLRNLAFKTRRGVCAVLVLTMIGCGGGNSTGNTSPATPIAPPPVGDDPFVPPIIEVKPTLPDVKTDGKTRLVPLSSAAAYGWNALIALNWPASTAPNTRGVADAEKNFGQPGTPTWITMRSKVEVYPGNGSATVPPHGVKLDAAGAPTNTPEFGYGDPPQYLYQNGTLPACPGQSTGNPPALIVLDETTQINNNQTFAGAAPAIDSQGFNTKPQLIRYAVKMNRPVFTRAIAGKYWYSGTGSPLAKAQGNFAQALSESQLKNPADPYVNFAPVDQGDPMAGIEIKSAWRPLSPREASSGRFLTQLVRYYEQPGGKSCYREAVWGLVGMHVISFSIGAPWVIWTTFEQADNILTADGRPTEDENGNPINRIVPPPPPTTPMLSSDPNVVNPKVTADGGYCVSPGSRLFFRENPNYGTMPSAGNICVNGRWSKPEPLFIKANTEAHTAIAAYLAKYGKGTSPLMYYKLVGAQGNPVAYDQKNVGFFSTDTSYQSANAVIETDYSLGNFTGNLVNGVPSNVLLGNASLPPYYNTRMLPFQSADLQFGRLQMGGCAGCHGFAGQAGLDFSFALGNNVTEPEFTDAFSTPNRNRIYFPRR